MPLAVGGRKQFKNCKSPGQPVRQVREPSKGFKPRHFFFYMQETVNWSPKLIPFRGRRVESTVQKGRQTLVFGGRCSGKPKGKPWSLTRLAHQASPNDLVMGGISRAGSRHSFTFIKRLFSSSLSDIRVVSCAYLRLLIFLLAILIPACASSRPVFLMMYLHIS